MKNKLKKFCNYITDWIDTIICFLYALLAVIVHYFWVVAVMLALTAFIVNQISTQGIAFCLFSDFPDFKQNKIINQNVVCVHCF